MNPAGPRLLKFVFVVLFGIGAVVHAAQAATDDDDFWLLLDYEALQNSLWLFGGIDDADGNYYGVTADLAIVDTLHFNFSATEQNYFVDTSELRWGLSGPVNQYFSWAILKTFWGKRDRLEKNDTRIELSSFYDGFTAWLSYEAGDVELFLRQSPRIHIDAISSDHRAYGLGLAYDWQVFYTQFSFKQHDYERDLSQLIRRPRLLITVNPVGIQQASALAESEAGILLGIQADKMSYEVFISRIKSAVTLESNTYATLHVAKVLSRQLTLGFDTELPVNDAPFSIGFSVGMMW